MTNTENSPVLKPGGRGLTGWRIAAWTGAGLVLMIPLIAMRFTDEVRWTGFDFIVAGAMLAALIGAAELAVRISEDWLYRAGAAVAAVAAFLMVWVQGAVGLVGSEKDPSGLWFLLPLAVGAVGMVVSRGRAQGLGRTLWLMAGAQAVVAAVGYGLARDADVFLTGLWIAAWAVSALLFGGAVGAGRRS